MSPRTKEQVARIRENRREHILEVSLELFAKQGISHTTMQQIANRAAISKGLIYNYFTSKEELLNEIIKTSIQHLYAFFDPDQDGILTDEEISYFIEQQVRMLKQNKDFWRFLFMLLVQPSAQELTRRFQAELLSSGMWRMIATYFRAHQTRDPEVETWLFLSLLDGVFLNYVFNPKKFPIDQVKELIIARYCNPSHT